MPQDGVIVTNDHVIRAFKKQYRPPDTKDDDWGVFALLLHSLPEGQVEIPPCRATFGHDGGDSLSTLQRRRMIRQEYYICVANRALLGHELRRQCNNPLPFIIFMVQNVP